MLGSLFSGYVKINVHMGEYEHVKRSFVTHTNLDGFAAHNVIGEIRSFTAWKR